MFAKQFTWSKRPLRRLLMSNWKDTNEKEIQKFLKIVAIMEVNSVYPNSICTGQKIRNIEICVLYNP